MSPTAVVASALAMILAGVAAPDPSALAARLADPSAKRRDQAARELLGMGRGAAPALTQAAASADPELRTRATALLALVRDADGAGVRERQAVDAVREAVLSQRGFEADSEFDVRLGALAPESSRALAASARRIAAHVVLPRSFACALARHADASTIGALAEFVRDERVHPSGGLAAARELDREFAAAPERAAELRAAAAPALASLVAAMGSEHAPTRRMAVAVFGALATPGAVASCAGATDRDAGVRAEAARVMGLYAPAQSARALRRLAADFDPGVREAALDALCRVPGVPHPEPAVAAANDECAAVRAAAANLLARDVTPETLPVLEALATDPSVRVRAAARRALAALPG